ncbi:MAG: hypothetical protein M3Y83_05175 [Actinomycetota bacterium]|nr:hypothetical protein [Actinomycetota bacterium]
MTDLNVAARAVAANHTGVDARFAMLSLDPSGCGAVTIEGQGELISNGNIHVNSSCTPDALHLAGEGEIVTAPTVACNVTGEFQAGGSADYNCTVNESVQSIPDPLAGRPEPEIPTDPGTGAIVYPTPPIQISGTSRPIPPGCPGSASPATELVPAACRFTGSYAGTTWRLYAGYYPGGINLESGTFYLEPGVYYVAGGFDPGGGVGVVSFRIAGASATVTSVDPNGTTLGGGIMIWNGEHRSDGLADPGLPDTPGIADGKVVLQGGAAGVNLWPLNDGSTWDKTVVAQDRDVCVDMLFVGGASNMEVRGVIYVPGLPLPGPPLCSDGPEGSDSPRVIAEGNGGTVVTDQIIAYRLQMRGNIGSLTAAFDEDFLPEITTAGLVE